METLQPPPASSPRSLALGDILIHVITGGLLGFGAALCLYIARDHSWALYVGGPLAGLCILIGLPTSHRMRRGWRNSGAYTKLQTGILAAIEWASAFVVGLFVVMVYHMLKGH
jgi:hypothetical protein